MVFTGMSGASHYDEVLLPIVVSDPIYMVDDFVGCKWAAQLRSHYEDVLADIAVLVGVWMARMENEYVAACAYESSTSPAWIILARELVVMFAAAGITYIFSPLLRQLPPHTGGGHLGASLWGQLAAF